jgi:hypothetical protein
MTDPVEKHDIRTNLPLNNVLDSRHTIHWSLSTIECLILYLLNHAHILGILYWGGEFILRLLYSLLEL